MSAAPSAAFYALIAGTGSGTGAAAALRFARSYPVVLLARSPASYQPVVDQIRAAGGVAHGLSADVADPAALDAALASVESDLLPGARLAAAVYNANAGFAVKPFLDLTVGDLDASLGTGAYGLFHFAQRTIPLLLAAVPSSPHPPSLIVTGATASVRGSARFASFAAAKFAQRALAQSLAREFGPRGVHVALAIVDGSIDTPWGKDRVANGGVDDGKIKPEAVSLARARTLLSLSHSPFPFPFALDVARGC
ncbi:putative secondary metabolism biosynthetic enzyme, variant 2 [Purpureocillium takamizusanense]|uniref:Secondary metabolism biosynthetic enzyme, variant 2 n=1 Tax=Purpureocillium takamizusanense TaxID=2060973 RepID=A0A9Q8QAN0_9HYPO|nr:putative secondary metabolism biosynthetic enzyme, variant 2 [Purpureocillium takamizusanense]UNI16135.1 putative secondary metabolism biosynthetic enzyme, variant 2 [Purpureocillium takamizusanense]